MAAKEKKFHVFGQTLAALSWDGEGEPVLALHGWLDNAASYIPLASQWQRPMVALDFSGHGHSDHRPDGVVTHLVDHVRDVLAVADQLGWQRFTLVGHSMGAGIACLFAADKRKPVYTEIADAVEARTRGFGGLSRDASALLSERGLMPVDGGWTWRADSRLRLTSSLRLTEEQVEGFVRAIQAPVCLILGEQGMGGNGMFDHRLGARYDESG